MYARVAPLKRLPKGFDIFDYRVPEINKDILKAGQLVSIPFRKSEIFGLVLSVSEETNEDKEKLKEITSIVVETPLLHRDDILSMQKQARLYGVAIGVILQSALPPLKKTKLKKLDLRPFLEKTPQENADKIFFLQYLNENEHQKIVRKMNEGQTLILVPEIKDIETIFALLSETQKNNCVIWHSNLGEKQQFEIWEKIRNNLVDIVIGTRSSIFLPFFDLKNIVIDFEEDDGHKQEDNAPRFSLKDIAPQKAQIAHSQLFFLSSHPSSETYYHIYKHDFLIPGISGITSQNLGLIQPIKADKPILIDTRNEKYGHKEDYFLSQRVQEKIVETDGDVFILVERKGSATSVYCKACGFIDRCPSCNLPRIYHESDKLLHCHYCKTKNPLPLLCPKCQTTLLNFGGFGTQGVEQTLSKLFFDQKNTKIIRIDGDIDENVRKILLEGKERKIILGTALACKYIDFSSLSVIVILDAERTLMIPEFKSEEKVWHKIQGFQYLRKKESTVYIQSNNPEHPLWKSLGDPDLFYRTDLKRRKEFGYPPYSSLCRYLCAGSNSKETKQEVEKVKRNIELLLTKEHKKAILHGPIELHPHYFRKAYWYGILVFIEPNLWQETIEKINSIIPQNWKIDPNPNSILSP